MLVSKRYLLIFNVFMIITGVTVGAYGYLIRPVATVGLMSDEWIYSPKNRGPYPEGVPLNNVLHLAFSSDYPTTIYVEFQEKTRKLASNVTELGMHFTLKDLGANTTIKSWALTYFDFEPSRTPCAMRFNLAFERPYPRLGRYFSASGIWFLAAGIGPHCYLWISKKLEEAATRMFLKLTLILSYFWTFVSIYYVFLGSDPHPHQPFYAAPLMRSLMLPLAISGTATIVVFVFTLSYYLLFHASFSIKLGFLFLFGFFLLLAVLYLRFAYAFPQNGIPIFLFVVGYGVLYAVQTRSEQMRSKPWLLPFSLGCVFILTIYSPIHELGHYLVARFDEATVRDVTWWWITESGIQKPNTLIDPTSFSSTPVYVLCSLAGLLITLVPFSVLFFIQRLKRSDWWHFSFILMASSPIFSSDDLYKIGLVAHGPFLAVCLALVSWLATGSLFFWYFCKKLPSIKNKK